MYLAGGDRLVFTDEALLEDENGLRLETVKTENRVYFYPAREGASGGVLEERQYCAKGWRGGEPVIDQVSPGRYTLDMPEGLFEGVKDMRLRIEYSGDIGHLFLNSRLINDNFSNGAVWEAGLREWAGELDGGQLVLYITPLKEGANVNVDSDMAARMEEVDGAIAKLHSAELCPVYEIKL